MRGDRELKSEKEVRDDIVEVGRRMWEKGYVAANDGNITVRLSEKEIVATPTGVSKGFLNPEMLVKVDTEGRVLEGGLQPSSEIRLHLMVYRHREDVCAVVHAHPPTATGFALAGIALDRPALPEVVLALKAIPLAGYGTPTTEEVPKTLEPYLQDYDAFLLANHGTLTVGRDVYQAYYRLETLEHCAKITLAARSLGSEQSLAPAEVQRLLEIREKAGGDSRGPCLGCGICEAKETSRQFVETCASATLGREEGCASKMMASEREESLTGGGIGSPTGRGATCEPTLLSDDELREIVARVAREFVSKDSRDLNSVWRE